MSDDLVKRLERRERLAPVLGSGSYPGGEVQIHDDGLRFVNPDGPEAVAEIQRLRAELDRLRDALEMIDLGYVRQCDER